MSVPGEPRPESTAQIPKPAGKRPSEPNQSMLITRESMCLGTRCISIVSHSVIAKPMQKPRPICEHGRAAEPR
jgi:hypothetical protein